MTTTLEPTKPKRSAPVLAEFLKPAVVRSAQNYLAARTLAEAKRAEVDAIERQLLTERVFMATLCTPQDTDPVRAAEAVARKRNENAERITDPKHVYLCQDEDLLQWYWNESHRREVAAGIKDAGTEIGHCPALRLENLQMKAEAHLVDVSGEHCGIKAEDIYCEKRDQWIDLVLKLLVNHPRTKHHFANANAALSRFVSPPNPS